MRGSRSLLPVVRNTALHELMRKLALSIGVIVSCLRLHIDGGTELDLRTSRTHPSSG
jgi:hypothetical protein